MPQLARGGKWVFGWVIVGAEGEVPLPPEAWSEYGFRAGEEAVLTAGSRRSGGLGVSTPALSETVARRMNGPGLRILARGRVGEGTVLVPREAGLQPGQRLLAVRGSRYALGLLARGPIYQAALAAGPLAVWRPH